jgi:hypothetical protein
MLELQYSCQTSAATCWRHLYLVLQNSCLRMEMVNEIVCVDDPEQRSAEGFSEDACLGGLPIHIVQAELWPRLVTSSSGKNDMVEMGKLRLLCKAWRLYVDSSDEWQSEMATIDLKRDLLQESVMDVI